MMAKLVCASALLAVAGAANAAQFGINVVDAGGVPGGLGAPITWSHPTNGAAYNNANVSGNNPPSQSLAGAGGLPVTAYDSYIAIDSQGPTIGESSTGANDGYSSAGPGNYLGLSSSDTNAFRSSGGNGSLIGVWFNTFVTQSSTAAGFGDHALFIGQVTLRGGTSAPTTAGLLINVIPGSSTDPAQGVLGTVRFGAANASNNGGLWNQFYYLDVKTSTPVGVPSAFATGTTYEIYVVSLVPTPGAAGLAGLAGVAALRRRRA
ncbi:MAG: hypothetical protein J0L61_08745 [Planctomycetes bacterium]|nr:hypothetical protein [Planctomycetota bacterium]